MFLAVAWRWIFCIYMITVAATVSLILFAFYPSVIKQKLAAWKNGTACVPGFKGYSLVGLYF